MVMLGLSMACSRDTKPAASAQWFQIQIENPRNIDCGCPEISFTTNHARAYQIIGNDMGRYVALGLAGKEYNVGEKYMVRIRKPFISEMPVCHALGYAWAQVYIAEIK